jgi:hypothetical protein
METMRKFLVAAAAVEQAPENINDDAFAALVAARNSAARAIAETPAQRLHEVASKIVVLSRIAEDRDGYGCDTGETVALSIRSDLDRLAPIGPSSGQSRDEHPIRVLRAVRRAPARSHW